MIKRTICNHIEKALGDWGKIVLVSGPRQVGKTTLARQMLQATGQGTYFNWDIVTDQRRLVSDPYFFQNVDRDPSRPSLVVLDEIHKYSNWQNWLKGAWDGFNQEFQFLVTGSGRLDHFRKGADSLMGRAVGVPLLPLSVGEILGRVPTFGEFLAGLDRPPDQSAESLDIFKNLSRFGGFPEPFVRGEEAFFNIWHQERMTMLVRQDIRDATRIRDISRLEILTHLIPSRVGSPLSINSLREDLGVAFETVRDWLLVLGQFFYLLPVSPFSTSLARAIRKENKVYLFDWSDISDPGPRFENLVAIHLHKAVSTWRAMGSGRPELHYVRDRDRREVDFVLTDDNRPVCLIECKSGKDSISPHLRYFQEKLRVPYAVQLVGKPGVCRKIKSDSGFIWVMSADRWLAMLP